MLLGKRQRPPIRRTTSMTGVTFDLSSNTTAEGDADSADKSQPYDQRFLSAVVSPRPSSRTSQRRNSADFVNVGIPHFLRACFLCKRRLIPGRDIYMYRGDSAFCSSECRQQQMNQDERKEKSCSVMVSKKKEVVGVTGSEVVVISGKGETVAAV